MKFLTTFIGFLPVLCAIQPSFADLRAGGARVSVASGRGSVASASDIASAAASRRIPTMISATTLTSTAVTGTTTTDSSLMSERECVDAYTECIRDPEVCGSEFEECTTSELFYAQKPKCNSVLLQCSSAGINTLFGTSSTANLATKNSNGEYVYPSAASVLGQFIEAGAINNRLDTSTCVKRYTSCLKKENVCGNDFELCTTNTEFKKQKLFCESTLARCQEDGLKELFGSANTSANPTSASRLGILIKEGGDLAATNAVATCYKVVDQCFLGACSENPYKCIVDSSSIISNITDAINEGRTLTTEQVTAIADARTSAQVAGYIRNTCLDTIGGNKYCYATFLGGGKMPTASQLRDEDNRDEVYAEAYSARMNASMREKISQIADKFDKKTKDKCVDTIMSCAMRSCGSGLGSACYQLVFKNGARADLGGTINGDTTYQEIKTGCEAIVNTDANCQYAASSANATTYNYNYAELGTFGTVFPTADTGKDPLGVVARLNGSLMENYNDAAIERMAKECKTTAVSCIRSLCGTDFVNCYRNRTDVMTDTYATATNEKSEKLTVGSGRTAATYDSSDFDRSMNKVGGVLDFTIVRGLCINTVKDADTCEEHLKIQMVKNYADGNGNTGWGDKKTVRDAWVDAVKDNYSAKVVSNEQVLIGCSVKDDNAGKCDTSVIADCGTVDESGCLYDKKVYQSINEYQLNMAADTLFSEVLGSLELEAQAKYNAKLTKEQNMCVAANEGGIMGKKDMTSTYMWAKLKNKRIPKNYSTNGLSANDFVASNDLYGSFCRARVSIQSDDPDIQTALQEGQKWSTAYFAVGDVFTCGSWIPQEQLEKIAKKVACKKAVSAGTLPSGTDCNVENIGLTTGQQWATAAATIGSGALGATAMDLLQGRTGLGGLLNTNTTNRNECTMKIDNEIAFWNGLRMNNICDKDGNPLNVGTLDATAGHQYCLHNYTMTTSGEVISKSAGSASIVGMTTKFSTNSTITTADKQDRIQKLNKARTDICGADSKASMWGRAGMDLLGAAALGTTGFFATRDNIKASNRQQFTADQEAFMKNVGDHIYCFIGADEAGTYGDLIEISID